MKNNKTRSIFLLAMMGLLLTVAVSGTLAYLVDATDAVVNTFTPSQVTTDVEEGFDGTTKTSVKVQVGENTDAFVRVAVVGYWAKMVNNEEVILAGWNGEIDYNETSWRKIGNYYYHINEVKAGAKTEELLGSSFTEPTRPDGLDADAYFVLNVLAQAVQSEPDSAVYEAWGVSSSNGVITTGSN